MITNVNKSVMNLSKHVELIRLMWQCGKQSNVAMSWANNLVGQGKSEHKTAAIFQTFKCIFNENVWIWIKISLKFYLKCLSNNIRALV